MQKEIKNKIAGTTLIEAMTVLFIFSIISVTFYSVWSIGLKYIMESKNKMGATALLNEKLEIIRNLPYASIGNTSNPPYGNIPATETKVVNGKEYDIETHIDYQDDPFDGFEDEDENGVTDDYKSVRVEIFWPGPTGGTSSIVGVARFVPPGEEIADPNTGGLSINIVDNEAAGFHQAHIHIATDDNAVNMDRDTDTSGHKKLSGFSQLMDGYRLTITAPGYETIETKSLAESAIIPIDDYTDGNASVIMGSTQMVIIYQDKLADLKIKSEDVLGAMIPSIAYHIEGGRKLGTNAGVAVYNLDLNDSTDASGEKNYNDKSPGKHSLSGIVAPSGYTLVGVDPVDSYDVLAETYEYELLPGADETLKISFASNAVPALLVRVLTNDGSTTPIDGAIVHVTKASEYDSSQNTKKDGVAFFSKTVDPLVAGDYDIQVTASGYQSKTESAVSVSQLTSKEIKLDLN